MPSNRSRKKSAKQHPRNTKTGGNTKPHPQNHGQTPSNVVREEKIVKDYNSMATEGVPGTNKSHAHTGNVNHNKHIRYHRRQITKLLRHRKRAKRVAHLSQLQAAPSHSEGQPAIVDLSLDTPTDSDKRNTLYIGGAYTALLQLARGWYAAIRKTSISYGPRAYNDKYMFDQVARNINVPDYDKYNSSHLFMVNFLHQVLINNFNHLLTTDTERLLTRLPEHLSFTLNVMTKKYILRVRNGIVNLASRLPVPIYKEGMSIYFEQEFLDPTLWMTSKLPNALLNQLFAIQQHKAYPFRTVDVPLTSLKNVLVHDEHGTATSTDMHIDEIVSVYGYATKPATETLGKYFYELSGLMQNPITNIFRFMFFPTFDSGNQDGDHFDVANYMPDRFNEKKQDGYFFDNDMYTVYFGMTGKISTADFCFVSEMPQFNSTDDIPFVPPPPEGQGHTISVTNKGLSYLREKYSSNSTMPEPYKPTTRSVPTYPEVTFSPHAYNLALQIGQALQSPYQLFAQIIARQPSAKINYSDYINLYYSKFMNAMNEASFDYGVFLVQYNNRFVLPSPIVEQFKSINSYNTWSYKDSPQSVTVQLYLKAVDLKLPTVEEIKPFNYSLFHLKGGDDLPEDFRIFQMGDYWRTYDGTEYRPYNFEAILASNDRAMQELRPYVKLNNCPEREIPLPSMHVMYKGNFKALESDIYVISIYTPLDLTSFQDKSMEIFIKYTLMPTIFIQDGINIPLLNISNRAIHTTPVGMWDTYEYLAIFNLYQLSFVSSYDGPSSEMDFYYSELRRQMIGSWTDMIPMLGNAVSGLLGGGGSEGVGDIVQSIMGSMGGEMGPMFNKVFDLLSHPAVQKQAPQFGMLGDILGMFGTPLRNMTNYDQNGYISTNITPPESKEKPKKKSFWSTLGDIALNAAPLLLELL